MFGSKCARCGKKSLREPYEKKPPKSWNVKGLVCSTCVAELRKDPYMEELKEVTSLARALTSTSWEPLNHSSLFNSKTVCDTCKEKIIFRYQNRSENFCLQCFTQKYGKVLLRNYNSFYTGGHKAIPQSTNGWDQQGHIYLTENYFMFVRTSKNKADRWEICIPLDAISIEKWGIEPQYEKEFLGLGVGAGTKVGGIGVGGGIGGGWAYDILVGNEIRVPYVDENGIPQEPKFSINSTQESNEKDIASKLYEIVAKRRKIGSGSSEMRPADNEKDPDSDPVAILKVRLAKGEITKEQFEELKRLMQ